MGDLSGQRFYGAEVYQWGLPFELKGHWVAKALRLKLLTHALYAYEAAAGVQFDSGMLATADIDLMIDSKKRLKLIATSGSGLEATGVLSVLCRADKSFQKMATQTFRAANKDGFMVDLIKPMPDPAWAGDALIKADPNDLEPEQSLN